MTLASAQITRWAVVASLSLATAVMFAVSLRGNYLYGYSLGQTDEKRQQVASEQEQLDFDVLISTIPLPSIVAVCFARAVCMAATSDHVDVEGSNTSDPDSEPVPSLPPATNTFPLGNSVAVCPIRGADIDPTEVHAPVPESYASHPDRPTVPSVPPVTRTLPDGSAVAVCSLRG